MLRSLLVALTALFLVSAMTPSFAKGGGSGGGMKSMPGAAAGGAKKKAGGGPPDLSFLDTGAENACPSGQKYQCRPSAYQGRPEICGCSSRR